MRAGGSTACVRGRHGGQPTEQRKKPQGKVGPFFPASWLKFSETRGRRRTRPSPISDPPCFAPPPRCGQPLACPSSPSHSAPLAVIMVLFALFPHRPAPPCHGLSPSCFCFFPAGACGPHCRERVPSSRLSDGRFSRLRPLLKPGCSSTRTALLSATTTLLRPPRRLCCSGAACTAGGAPTSRHPRAPPRPTG